MSLWRQLKEAIKGDKVEKKTISLQGLREEHAVMEANAEVTLDNSALVVESLRSIAETVIWGDQNDPSVFDFFLEKVCGLLLASSCPAKRRARA